MKLETLEKLQKWSAIATVVSAAFAVVFFLVYLAISAYILLR